ncbi:MAG: acyl-CoA dehydrogenase [Calditrichaeota bacterium]|nr:acyl-CoA dehydrogenase [Calditrichota bacterium]
MDFELTDEQKMLQDMAYKFAVNEFTPIAKECDREERYPREVWKKACENGLIGAFIPEAYGGAGVGVFENALITEQFSRVDLGVGSIGAATFGAENIILFGTEEQKKKYLPPLVNGEAISAGAYTEPDAGTDVAGIKTTAKKDGSDYVINGSKMFITNGTICNFMIVLAVTNPEAEKRHQRQSLILVEADREGITRTKIHGKMGIRASDTAEIVFDNVRVPQSNLIGQEGRGFYEVMQFFDVTRLMVAAQGVGLAQGALDLALKYVQERKTFGQPIIANQAVQFKLAEMATHIELARTLTYRAAWLADKGTPDPKLNAMAKFYSGQTAVWVANEALQLHGGYGYIDEYDIQRFYRDARILEIYEGVREAELMTIARRLV